MPPYSRRTSVVDARVLGDGEEVGGELAVVEEVEEALHVGEVAALACLLRARRRRSRSRVAARARREDVAATLEAEEEAAELEVRRLVRGVDLVDGEVLALARELLDELRQVDGRALGATGGSRSTQPMPFSARCVDGWMETLAPVSALQ